MSSSLLSSGESDFAYDEPAAKKYWQFLIFQLPDMQRNQKAQL